jgi:hypothetical protein
MGADRPPTGQRRVTVAEAAEILGLTVEAVRGRIKRGKLEHAKEDGTVYVLLDTDRSATRQTGQQPVYDQPDDQSSAQAEIIKALREQVAYMREQLAEEREARRRADTIIAQLSQASGELASTIRELAAPKEVEEKARGEDTGGGKDAAEERGAGREPFSPFSIFLAPFGTSIAAILFDATFWGPPSVAVWAYAGLALGLLLPVGLGFAAGRGRRGALFEGVLILMGGAAVLTAVLSALGIFGLRSLYSVVPVYAPQFVVIPAVTAIATPFLWMFSYYAGMAWDRRKAGTGTAAENREASVQIAANLVGLVITGAATVLAAWLGGG